jgi:hypothetical protein
LEIKWSKREEHQRQIKVLNLQPIVITLSTHHQRLLLNFRFSIFGHVQPIRHAMTQALDCDLRKGWLLSSFLIELGTRCRPRQVCHPCDRHAGSRVCRYRVFRHHDLHGHLCHHVLSIPPHRPWCFGNRKVHFQRLA